MPKLTAKFIDSLPAPASGQVILRDDDLTGFGLRMTPNKTSYIAEARVNGTVRRVTIGRADLVSVSDARKEARRVLAMMASGKDPADPAADVTLAQVLQDYLAVRTLRPGTQRAYLNVTRQRLADWLPLPISQITQRMVDDRHRYITTDGGKWKASKAQANQTMRILKALLNFANTHYERAMGSRCCRLTRWTR